MRIHPGGVSSYHIILFILVPKPEFGHQHMWSVLAVQLVENT